MENVQQVRRYLGGRDVIGMPKNELDFVPIIRRGFPFAAFTSVHDRTQLSEEELCASLRIAKRTVARRKNASSRLKPHESELLLRLAQAQAKAANVLGSEAKASQWLKTPNRALGGAVPLSLLDTGLGFQEVMDVLTRVEYGVHS